VVVNFHAKNYGKEVSWEIGGSFGLGAIQITETDGDHPTQRPSPTYDGPTCQSYKTYGDYSNETYGDYSDYSQTCCLQPGPNTLTCTDSFGDGWNGGFITINGDKYCEQFDDYWDQQDVMVCAFEQCTNTNSNCPQEVTTCTDACTAVKTCTEGYVWNGHMCEPCTVDNCAHCLAHTKVPIYYARICMATPTPASVQGWRIWAKTTKSGWAWDVIRLKFIADGAELEVGPCKIVDSGHYNVVSGYTPDNAFKDGNLLWGGRKLGDEFFIGLECTAPAIVQVKLNQGCDHSASGVGSTAVKIQKKVSGKWIDAGVSENTACDKEVTIFPKLKDTPAPTPAPTLAPTPAPAVR